MAEISAQAAEVEQMKESIHSEKRERMRIRGILKQQRVSETLVTPGYQTHAHLLQIVTKLPTDFEPYGQVKRASPDCSSGCRWYHVLAGRLGQDWGVCANPRSPRSGLLTFEHQGCLEFEEDPRSGYLETPKGRNARRLFEEREEELRRWRQAHRLIRK
jgi:hypothetical protein